MNWILQTREKAKKALLRFPKKDRERIEVILDEMVIDPYSGDIEKLDSKDNLWRRRTGAFRIKFQICSKENIIYIYEIGRRTSKTY